MKDFIEKGLKVRACHEEKLHINGKIQDRGFLVAVNIQNKTISHISSNLVELLNEDPTNLIDHKVAILNTFLVFEENLIFQDYIDIALKEDENVIKKINVLNRPYYLVHYQVLPSFIVFELEPILEDKEYSGEVLSFVNQLLQYKNIDDILNYSVEYLRNILGMDRVMIYRFCKDNSGEVIAESKEDSLESFLHLRYPESDIPQQARQLYLKTKFRSISDVNSKTIDLISHEASPLDLTFSVLRAVSPTHIHYLQNMHVGSSYSVSLIHENRLWGLVSCHASRKKEIDFKVCQLSVLISNVMLGAIEQKKGESLKKDSIHFSQKLLAFQNIINKSSNIYRTIYRNFAKMLAFSNADGFAFSYNDKILKTGISFSQKEIKELIDWFSKNHKKNNFYSNNLSVDIPNLSLTKEISGLYIREIKELNLYLLWFKKNHAYEIQWAGNPSEKTIKLLETNQIQPIYGYQPRKSFLINRQKIDNESIEWNEAELTSIDSASNFLLEVLKRDLKTQADFQKEIEKLRKEKDFFSYTVSHDLKTPLTVISTYTDLLKYYISKDNIRERNVMNKISESIQRMSAMIDGIKEMANIESSTLNSSPIDMDALTNAIINDLTFSKYFSKFHIVKDHLEDLNGGYHLIYHCFYNILSNAFKYSSHQPNPEVVISSTVSEKYITYTIRDNGIGIPLNNHPTIFEIFTRAENASDFEGSGIGLSIVKNIIQKHEGTIHFISSEDFGTCFYLRFPIKLLCKK